MMLISVDAFVEAVNEHIRALIELWHKTSTPEIKIRAGRAAAVFSEAALMAKALPRVDAVEVVRCRDCKLAYFYEHKDKEGETGILCTEYDADVTEDDFCSHGERRQAR